MKNRLGTLLLTAGLLVQFHTVYQQIYRPTSPPAQISLDPAEPESPDRLGVCPLAQQTSDSSGQTVVAMAINSLTGQHLDDKNINDRYGYELLPALREQCAPCGLNWRDAGEIAPDKWALIEHKILEERLPVILALNGPEFSVNGRGTIVLLCGLEGERVTLADPATGTFRITTRANINAAPSHPQGNFIFVAERSQD